MSVEKHTPGPWIAEAPGGRGAWIKGANDEWAALSCGDTDAIAAANATLIAAAPELLAELQAIIPRFVACMRGSGTAPEFAEAAVASARAVVAKAAGSAVA